MPRSILALPLCLLLACGGGVSTPSDDASPDDPDAAVGGNDGVLPPRVVQSGVAYVAHFNSTELRAIRLDTPAPAAGETLELGQFTHDLVLDDRNDRLIVVSDVARTARLFGLERPAAPGAAIAAPTELATIPFADIPRFALVNPLRERLYVVTADPDQSPLVTMSLHAFDTTDPANPTVLEGWPQTIPVTVSFSLDAVRDVVFLVELTTDTLHGFDLHDDGFEPLAGGPVDLLALFPQENQFAFQARALTADVERHRLVAARSQSALSELIVIEYRADIPTGAARYGDFASMTDLVVIEDGLDVDVPLAERPNLLDAYQPAVDTLTGAVFMSSDAWNGNASTASVTAFAPDASLAVGCDDAEGFGCFLRSHVQGAPGSFVRTDGATCVDGDHRRVLATSIDAASEGNPGLAHVFDIADDLSMAVVLPATAANLPMGALPIGAVCH